MNQKSTRFFLPLATDRRASCRTHQLPYSWITAQAACCSTIWTWPTLASLIPQLSEIFMSLLGDFLGNQPADSIAAHGSCACVRGPGPRLRFLYCLSFLPLSCNPVSPLVSVALCISRQCDGSPRFLVLARDSDPILLQP